MAGGYISVVAEGYKPCAAMVATQCIFAALTLWVKAAFNGGMSPMVFVPSPPSSSFPSPSSKLKEMRLGVKGFFLVFLAALFGATAKEPGLPRAAIRDVDTGHDHDKLDTSDHLCHGGSSWVST
nr:unnamed protein product [Digitaria exilis]